MKKYIIIFFVLFISNFSYANSSCDLVRRSKLSIAIHESNFSNQNTTRTPEGGPYKFKELVCGKTCEIKEIAEFKMVYEPGHPDADVNGYVSYPSFDAIKEYKALSADALNLKNLGHECTEVANLINNPNSAELEYRMGNIKRDTFNFKLNFDLISWQREGTDGRIHTHNY